MKKIILLLVVVLTLGSCSKTDNILSAVKSEIGEPTNIIKSEINTFYRWDNISRLKCNVLKNTIDKESGILPTKESGLNSYIVKGVVQTSEYYIWEKSDFEVQLAFTYISDEFVNVRLFITKK